MNHLSKNFSINPFLSLFFMEPDIIITSLYSKIKKIKCDVGIFKKILSSMEGKLSVEQTLEKLKKNHSEKFINHVFSTLIDSGIIISNSIESHQNYNFMSTGHEIDKFLEEKLEIKHVGLAGNGLIAQSILDNASKICRNSNFKSLDVKPSVDINYSNLKNRIKDSGTDFLIACPEKETHGWFLAINEVCLDLNLPWIVCYFNGENIILGPTMIPSKTPCYGCLIEHRLKNIYENSGLKLPIKHIREIVECWPLNRTPVMSIIANWVGGIIVSEALRIIDGTVYPQFIKKQTNIQPYLTTSFKEIRFEAITTCRSCHGINREKLTIGRPKSFVSPNKKQFSMKNPPLKHIDGGYRALGPENAKKLINDALDKIGISVKIEKSTNGPLDDILPSYMAKVSDFCRADYPFLITEKNQWGKGVTDEQAFLSGCFELFERICSEYYGNVDMVRAPYKEVQDIALDVKSQIGTIYFDRGIERFNEDIPIDWVWGYSLIQERPLLVPASMVYITKSKFCGHFHPSTSGGHAAGTSIEDAILQGLMETIEHDAWMIWQANGITTPQVRNESIEDDIVLDMIERIEEVGFRVIIRYLPTDIGIPVFRTWIVNENNYVAYAGNGLGANLDSKIALKRSITEAKLYLPSFIKKERLYYGNSNNLDVVNNKTSLFYLYHFISTDIFNSDKHRTLINFDEIPGSTTGSISGDIEKAIKTIKNTISNPDVAVVSLENKSLNIPVVKIIPVGLQKLSEPIQCVQNRLFQLPVTLGYRDYELTYQQLYNDRYPR
jgi:thiazole/oxazole-forming peptide maturase SagD family component